MPKSPVNQFKRSTARRLRSNATDAENKLWRQLRRLEMHGTHFRRQAPIGDYVVDFACMAAHLVIEVDGSQHGSGEVEIRDRQRTQWLEAAGYRVLRFWNNEVNQNIHGVLDAIYEAVYGSPNAEAPKMIHTRRKRDAEVHPTPSRSARRPSPSRGG
jgi:very-short-patch-repair endonuclease